MSGKFLARASALSLALILAACGGGGDDSTPLSGNSDNSSSGGGESGENTGERTYALGTGEGDSFIEGQINASTTSVSAGGQSVLSLNIVATSSGNALASGEELSVSFSSPCISTGKASINTPISSSGGYIETIYSAQGCASDDLVTATLDSNGATSNVVLSISPPTARRINANEPEPSSISPSSTSTGGRPAVSTVTFNVVDENGSNVDGIDVFFKLSPAPSITGTDVSLGITNTTSQGGGLATTRVIAGEQNTVVRVVATINVDGQDVSTTSPPITINSLLPIQEAFSISLDNFLPDAQFTDGVVVNASVRAADRYGNVIRGNTIVNFTVDGGAIVSECTLDDNGECSVAWRSQAPRVTRPTILARTVGETLISGANCSDPANTSCTYELGEITQEATFLVSSSREPEVTLTQVDTNEYCASATVITGDNERVPPPAGTTVEFSINDTGEILSTQTSRTIPTSADNVYKSAYETCIFAQPNTGESSAQLTVVVTTPKDNIAEALLQITP